MTGEYRIFGNELSPYCVKVRSYLRFKGLPHKWIVRGTATEGEFQKHAKMPLIPLVVTPQGEALQDSTPLIELMEARHPDPALQPPDGPRAFLSSLIEEYADEWGNKTMFHYRWANEIDRRSASLRIAQAILGPDAGGEQLEQAAIGVEERMMPRLHGLGSHVGTQDLIELSFRRQLTIAEAHLGMRSYLFGGRPCLADFGWAAQMYEMASDPTAQALMQHYPATMAWVHRMASPTVMGEFEPWEKLAGSLTPLLQEEVARRYLPWAHANAKASASGDPVEVELGGVRFTQAAQQQHVKSLQEICRKATAAIAAAPELAAVLKDVECHDLLLAACA